MYSDKWTKGKCHNPWDRIFYKGEEMLFYEYIMDPSHQSLIENATKSYFDSVGKRRSSIFLKGIKKVIYNNPATIVLWGDGTKTVIECHKEDTYDHVIGLLLCVIKKCTNGHGYSALCKLLDEAYAKKNNQ